MWSCWARWRAVHNHRLRSPVTPDMGQRLLVITFRSACANSIRGTAPSLDGCGLAGLDGARFITIGYDRPLRLIWASGFSSLLSDLLARIRSGARRLLLMDVVLLGSMARGS